MTGPRASTPCGRSTRGAARSGHGGLPAAGRSRWQRGPRSPAGGAAWKPGPEPIDARTGTVRRPHRAAAPGPQGARPFRDRRWTARWSPAPRCAWATSTAASRRAAESQNWVAESVHAGADLRDLLAHPRHRLRPGRREAGRGAGAAAGPGHPRDRRRAGAHPQPPALAGRGRARGAVSTRSSCTAGGTGRPSWTCWRR